MSNGRGALWAVLALLGIALAAGLTWSVMRLSGEHIGLASAPISVVRGLAPGPAGGAAPPEHDVTRTVTRTVTVSRTVTEAPLTSRTATTTTSAVTIGPPSATRRTPDRSDDGRESSRSGSGGGRDD